MIRNSPDEQWKDIKFKKGIDQDQKFRISTLGRVLKLKDADYSLVKDSFINGYLILNVKREPGTKFKNKSTSLYIHKLMADAFLEKPEDAVCVLHLDYDKKNNKLSNLKWATKREKELHQFANPFYEKRGKFIPTSKLSEGRVRLIKRKLFDPNRRTRLKMIAKQFGVSTMQLHRIKTGENWGHITDF
ncbi:HNH endonuclease [uncultured Polaribacter sp.]|uniref:HNH endonuclease n=1 Tax=uncultured Polaribacter sp. TaxID=174711 RepID=UPI00262A2A17|nr:HNH endonuclease [uncultured Polaribacter sp.]